MSFFAEIEKRVEREFRKWTERVFGPADSDELLIVHRAILAEIEGRIETAQRGRHIFPYNYVRVRLVSADEARRALFTAAFAQDRRLEGEVRECLAAAGCDIPAGFAVEVETAAEGAKAYEIIYEIRDRAAAPKTARRLLVVTGKADADSFALEKARTNIGRLREITDAHQAVVRRNDVVFEEGADEANATVSRAHAHIRFHNGEHRIVDEGSEYGTRIFRDGRSIAVPPGGTRGERLVEGDEIFLGRACLRFE